MKKQILIFLFLTCWFAIISFFMVSVFGGGFEFKPLLITWSKASHDAKLIFTGLVFIAFIKLITGGKNIK